MAEKASDIIGDNHQRKGQAMNFWDKAGDALKSIAPTIGGLVGGPLGAGAVNAVMDVLGVKQDAKDTDIAVALAGMTTEQRAAIIKLDNDYKLELERIALEKYRVDASDRDSARRREKDVGGKAVPILAAFVISGSFCVVAYVLGGNVPLTGSEGIIVGSIVNQGFNSLGQVLNYYFGSSAGSANKDRVIHQVLEK